MKKALFIFISIIALYGCDNENARNVFKVDLNDPYNICGETIYLSDFSYNNELEITSILSDIEEICKYQKIENVKDEINDLLDDDGSYSRREILERLQQIYYNYLEN